MSPKRVLIVEDTQTVAILLRMQVKSWGQPLDVLHATNGSEALRVARCERPDFIISDVRMPLMDGFQLCEALRADKDLRDIPVVLLTAMKDPQAEARSRSVGATAFLYKPRCMEKLREEIGPYFAFSFAK